MFAMLPNLKYLDGYDIHENEASSDEGEFLCYRISARQRYTFCSPKLRIPSDPA